MDDSEKIPRLSRLTAILLKLQTRPMVTVKQLAKQHGVSTRTIYRDIAALEQSGVPIVNLENGNYSLVEGYTIPPVMFTTAEANALIVAQKIIARTKDTSLIEAFSKATDKIKAVLRNAEKEKANFLSERIIIGENWSNERTSDFLSDLKESLTNFKVVKIHYTKENDPEATERCIEPFAIYRNPEDNWVLIAWCRLRDEFRNFRLDRIQQLQILDEHFPPHKISMEEYVELQRKKYYKE